MILKAEPLEIEDLPSESLSDFDEERFLEQTASIRDAYVTKEHPELVHCITEPDTLTLKTNEAVAVSPPPSPSVFNSLSAQTRPVRSKSAKSLATSSVGKLSTKKVKQNEAKQKTSTPMVELSPSALGAVSSPPSASAKNTAASTCTSAVASVNPSQAVKSSNNSTITGKTTSNKRKAGGGGKGGKRGRSNIEDVTELYNDEEDEQVLCGICSSWDPPDEMGGDGGGATTEWIGCDCDR